MQRATGFILQHTSEKRIAKFIDKMAPIQIFVLASLTTYCVLVFDFEVHVIWTCVCVCVAAAAIVRLSFVSFRETWLAFLPKHGSAWRTETWTGRQRSRQTQPGVSQVVLMTKQKDLANEPISTCTNKRMNERMNE